MGLSEKDQAALAEVRKKHPDMTEEEYLRTLDNGLAKLRRAMVAKGFPEYADMTDEEISEHIYDAMLAERDGDDTDNEQSRDTT